MQRRFVCGRAVMRDGAFPLGPPLQRRASSLVDFLVAGAKTADAPLRQQVSALIERRSRSGERLAEQLEQVRERLLEIQVGRQRIVQVAPAYRERLDAPTSLQLSARG